MNKSVIKDLKYCRNFTALTFFFNFKKDKPKTNLEKRYQYSVTLTFLWTSKFAFRIPYPTGSGGFASNLLKLTIYLHSVRPIKSPKFLHLDHYENEG